MFDPKPETTGWHERLSSACSVPADYDDEDMSVRQGDVKAALNTIERLRKEFLSDCEAIGYSEEEALEMLADVESGKSE